MLSLIQHTCVHQQVAKEFDGNSQLRRLLSSDERDALFRDTDTLYDLSNTLLAHLIKRWESSAQGIVMTVADVVADHLHAFDAYVSYCSKERRTVRQQLLLQYSAQFGHPFQAFLERLHGKSADLETLVARPLHYVELWPAMVKNLMQDTSKTRQPEEYRALKRLLNHFTSVVADLNRVSAFLADDLKRRFVNFTKINPHLQGRRLLKESPAQIVSGSGVDFGDQAFLFDTCLVFARKAGGANAGATGGDGEAVFRALKKVKLDGLRIVDVQKATLSVRTGGDRYYIAFPNSSIAIEWRNLVAHKNYRHEMLEYSDVDEDGVGEGIAYVSLPKREPAYDAHITRVQVSDVCCYAVESKKWM